MVRRIAQYQPETRIQEIWRRFVEGTQLPAEMTQMLLDPDSIRAFTETADVGLARMVQACTHTTFAPTVMHGGIKTNIIPDFVELQVDIRTLPGQTGEEVQAQLREALGDLASQVEIAAQSDDPSTASPIDTPLWDSLQRATAKLLPGAATVPFLLVGATDARFFRRAGATAYGAGLFSERISFADFASMFHGDNERIDIESIELTTRLWEAVINDFLL